MGECKKVRVMLSLDPYIVAAAKEYCRLRRISLSGHIENLLEEDARAFRVVVEDGKRVVKGQKYPYPSDPAPSAGEKKRKKTNP